MKFDELYKKVIDSCKAFEERQVPISLDFKIEDLRDALVESNDTIEKLEKKLMPCLNGDCILTCEVVEKYGKENAELKADNKMLKEHIANGDVSRITWIDEVIELKEAQRWRKFSEEKPEHDAWCLVFHEGEIDADHYTDDCNSHDRFVMYGHYVTHWMPLPKAPEEYK